MTYQLGGKVAIVTGSTSGIGEGIARALAAAGAAVIVSGLTPDRSAEIVGEIGAAGGQARFVQADLTDPASCAALVASAEQHFGRLDILVNNAGIYPNTPLGETSAAAWDQVFAVNTRGPFLCSQAAVPLLRRQGAGAIVNIGSTHAYRGFIERSAYAASKAALLSLTKTLARGLAEDRIRVNWITVGWVASHGEIAFRDQTHGDGRAFLADMAQKMPFGRLETPEDIGAGVVFLCSEAASHITGAELNISGGLWM